MARPIAVAALALALAAPALAEETAPPWRAELDAVCGRTEEAMTLTTEELRALVARADKLLPELEKLPDGGRKVWTRRLQSCRKLYAFVVETREAR